MPSSYITELSLRAAVNTTKRNLTSDEDQTDTIQTIANERARAQVTGSSDTNSVSTQMNLQAMAIDLALVGLKMAYEAIKKQKECLNSKRLDFDIERQVGVATFMVPINKEERDLSIEEQVLKSFFELSFNKDNQLFSTYLGIHTVELLTGEGAKFYSVLPFYRMSESLGQPVASTKPLDKQRMAINLFFRSALPDAIADIETHFQIDSKFSSFWASTVQGKNYLNDRRAPRLIMISLSNLLWNLQHPVDTDVGYPLGLSLCIELCHKVEYYLNHFLNAESRYYLGKISNQENRLISFLRKIEIHTKALREAYEEELLHGINIDEVTNSAHRALRIMDKSVFKLIYQRYNPITKKNDPDDRAAENIAYFVSYLNEIVSQNKRLIRAFYSYPEWINTHHLWLNRSPKTIMDILIIFCHLSKEERDYYLKNISKSGTGSAIEFVDTMQLFYHEFIRPIRAVSKKELRVTPLSPQHEAVGRLTARRIIPLISLVVEDYRIDVDTPETHEDKAPDPLPPGVMRGKQQVQAINLSAKTGGANEYYAWTLSPFVKLSPGTAKEFDTLPKHQYRMTQMTQLMDSVRELVENYRNLLQYKLFQTFLLKCLSKVKEEYQILDHRIDQVEKYLTHDELISRSLQSILRPMMNDLNTSLDAFAVAAANFERVVSAPSFIIRERDMFKNKLLLVDQQFKGLFDESSGIDEILNALPEANLLLTTPNMPPIVPSKITVETRKVLALRKLVQHCHDALSSQSKKGHKGALLRDLLNMMDRKTNFTEGNLNQVIMELTHIVACFRETWFFQAAYAQTRSAKILIEAIKDPCINGIFPLAAVIFDDPQINPLELSNEQILKRMRHLREVKHWPEAVSQIPVVACL